MMRHRKIVIAATEMSTGGLGSYLDMLMMGLRSRGWSVYLLVTNQRGDLQETLEESFVCHDLSNIPLSRKKVVAAVNLLNEISPEILLMNHVSLVHYALPLLRSDIKTVAVLHSDDARFYKISTLFGRRIFRWIAPSPGLADQCANYLSPELSNRVRVVPHGVREDVFCPDSQDPDRAFKKISFVGFLGETKGADMLPDIMVRVLGSCPGVRLSLIGDGPLRLRLEHRLQELGLLDRCDLAGSVSRDIVAHYLRESDIFLLPTRLEGFGLTIVEAMMSGAVPVVSRLPGITDFIVNDGVTGFLVEQENIQGFAEAIINLLKKPERLKSMSIAARIAVAERFSEKRMVDSYEALFAEDDDRERLLRRGGLGWVVETIGEIINRGIDRKWLVRRALELSK
jgi:glycosyltransferase involved in cell wall biosynthesis